MLITQFKNEIVKRKKPVIVRPIPNFSSNPNGINYAQYCKYQLLKLKPWANQYQNAWDNDQQSDEIFVAKWQEFLSCDLGQSTVPQWQRHLADAMSFLSDHNSTDDITRDEIVHSVDKVHEDWMYLARMIPPPETMTFSLHEIVEMRSSYSTAQILEMPFWLDNIKTVTTIAVQRLTDINLSLLNSKQSIVYDIVR